MSRFLTGSDSILIHPLLDAPTARDGGKPRYSACVQIPKANKAVLEAAQAALEETIDSAIATKWGGKRPVSFRSPLRDGDTERTADYFADTIFVNASTTRTPLLYHLDGTVAAPHDFTSGTVVKAELSFYPYTYMGRCGIACGLERLWLIDKPKPYPRDSADKGSGDADFDAFFG